MMELVKAIFLLPLYATIAAAGNVNGYHYEKPSLSLGLVEAPTNLEHGHSFGPLPTVQPLPPVPALPALPTPRSKGQFVQTQTIYQTHPAISSSIGKIAQRYQPPSLQLQLSAQQSITSSVKSDPTGVDFSSPSAARISEGSNPSPLSSQPLRVPFGKEAVISFPSESPADGNFDTHSRQLHQYAVVEIIDNDIEQNTPPFYNSPFFDSYRAHVGASGSAANPQPLARSFLGSRSNSAFLGQPQPIAQRLSTSSVALGSGGLGFIRLANGNVYLGSGSLGYVSGQQHSQDINEARTRTGAPQPDALHFGHGPLGITYNKLSSRFK